MQEWRVSAFDCQGTAVCRSGESQRLNARDLPYTGVESQSLTARDLPYAGVESLRVWLPGTCRIQEWRVSAFGCQGPAVCRSGVSEFGCQGPAVCRSGESQSLAARDLQYAGVESQARPRRKRCQVANNERRRSTVSACYSRELATQLTEQKG